MAELAAEDVAYGARLLALGMPHDVIVPADRASLSHEASAMVAPNEVWGHSSIVRAAATRSLAYSFLRDAAAACRGIWDRAAPLLGRTISQFWAGLGRILGR
jgi:hypothetical protein